MPVWKYGNNNLTEEDAVRSPDFPFNDEKQVADVIVERAGL